MCAGVVVFTMEVIEHDLNRYSSPTIMYCVILSQDSKWTWLKNEAVQIKMRCKAEHEDEWIISPGLRKTLKQLIKLSDQAVKDDYVSGRIFPVHCFIQGPSILYIFHHTIIIYPLLLSLIHICIWWATQLIKLYD